MRFLSLIILSFLLSFGNAHAYENERTVQNEVTHDTLQTYSTITVPSTTTVMTDSQSLVNTGLATNLGIMYKATSSGTVALSLQALRSFQRPAVEGSTDATYVVWNTNATTADQNWHLVTLDTVVEPYLVYKITGTSGNDASTKIQIKVEKL